MRRALRAVLPALALAGCGPDPTHDANTPPAQGPAPPGAATIRVDDTARHQTINGWEAVAQIGQVECPATSFARYRDEVLDRAVNELGLNRVRVALPGGVENPGANRYFADVLAGRLPFRRWVDTRRYEVIDDNGDPGSAAASGFGFAALDHDIAEVVQPLRERLAARGERLFVNLNYTNFDEKPHAHRTPDEYAELMLVTFEHLRDRWGWTPDAIEMVLEPDNAGWSAAQIGAAMVAAGDRLRAAGFEPEFIAPSNADMRGAIEFFDALIAQPRVKEYLSELSYHRYRGASDANLRAIGSRARQHGIRSAMLEHIGSGHEDLHDDLELARASAWQQFALAFCSTDPGRERGSNYYTIDIRDPGAPIVLMNSRTRYLQQYFRHVRAGAQRIGAMSSDDALAPLAFVNPAGDRVVIVKADAAGTFRVEGLPPGSYGGSYTTASELSVSLPERTVGPGQALTVAVPAAGVVTIVGR
jgi:hypothetical protein